MEKGYIDTGDGKGLGKGGGRGKNGGGGFSIGGYCVCSKCVIWISFKFQTGSKGHFEAGPGRLSGSWLLHQYRCGNNGPFRSSHPQG